MLKEQRATFEPDHGRRGKLWLHGAFEPASGEATLVFSQRRDGASHIRLLEKMIQSFPAERWLVVENNLSTHHSREVKTSLLAWPEIQLLFLPKYASWLNLIEPWWKRHRTTPGTLCERFAQGAVREGYEPVLAR